MGCNHIYIFKGDDTNWNGENFLTVNITPQPGVDLSTMTGEFILGAYHLDNIDLSTGTFKIDLSKTVTGSYSYGPINGTIRILDNQGRVKTVCNTIPFYITNKVIVEQDQTLTLDLPQGSPVTIDITVGDANTSVWGQITGDIEDQTDLQESLAGKVSKSGDTMTGPLSFGDFSISSDDGLAKIEGVQYGLRIDTTSGLGAALFTANGVGNILTTLDVKSTYSSTGTDPVNGTAVASAISTKQDTLSQAQLSAVNSGITSSLVTQIGTNTTNISNKQDTLVSGTNIKTVNNNSLLGSGNISIDSLPSQTGNSGKFLTTDGTSASWGTPSGTVDQTYDPTSTNAQSGTAVAEAVAPALKNTATGAGAITILGTSTSAQETINIGEGSKSTAISNSYPGNVVIGTSASGSATMYTGGSVAIGGSATASNGSIAIGAKNNYYSLNGAYASAQGAIAIGTSQYESRTEATADSAIAIGKNAKATAVKGVAIGADVTASAEKAIQLGEGTNSTANSFQVFNYQMLDANGHIPNERIYYPQPLYKGYTIVGNDVTVNDNNIASGFKSYGNLQANNSYLLLNNKIPSYTIMEIYMEFTCGNFNLDKGYPLFVNNTTIRDWYIQGNTSDNTAYYMRRWNGNANVDGVTMLSSGQTYKTKYVFNKSNVNTETAYIMVNGSWVKQFEVTSATDWWTNNYFGIGGSYAYEQGFDGSINLNETAIYLDGNCFFNGAKNWIPSTAAITGVTGYSSSGTQVLKNVNGVLQWVTE